MVELQLDPSSVEDDRYVHEDDYIALYIAAFAVLDAFRGAGTLTQEQRIALATLERRVTTSPNVTPKKAT